MVAEEDVKSQPHFGFEGMESMKLGWNDL